MKHCPSRQIGGKRHSRPRVPHTQRPPLHVSDASSQELPQLPQLPRSLDVLMHAPVQQDCPPPHARPQTPHDVGSRLRSRHAPSQQVNPPVHPAPLPQRHTPPMHSSPVPQPGVHVVTMHVPPLHD